MAVTSTDDQAQAGSCTRSAREHTIDDININTFFTLTHIHKCECLHTRTCTRTHVMMKGGLGRERE